MNWALAGRFVRDVTHDVNNQLGAVLAYSELLALEAGARDELKSMVGEITTAVQRTSLLMDTLAAIPGRDLTTVQSVDLCGAIRESLMLVEREIDRRNIRLTVSLPEGPAVIAGVHTRIVRLIVHALRYALDELDEASDALDLRIDWATGLDTFSFRFSGPRIGRSGAVDTLLEASQHAAHHRGTLSIRPGSITVVIPRETGLA
jgi:C4-dicarboxylate-specific signal transduction histidine kinase